MGDTLDVESPRSNIRGHQDGTFLGDKLAEGCIALVLLFVSVYRTGGKSLLPKEFCDHVDSAFCVGKNHNRGLFVQFAKDVVQLFVFHVVLGFHKRLLDGLVGDEFSVGRALAQKNFYCFFFRPHEFFGNLSYRLGPCSREEECLSRFFRGQGGSNLFELRFESHVQHSIGFVQNNKMAEFQSETRRFSIEEIAKTSRCCNDDLGRQFAQFLDLCAGVGATVQADRCDPDGSPEFDALSVYLNGQFTRW
mmetsp:Transcript_18579/g.46077  ORF Transcript_18579/g.46077 Transcript_18579/m.46077 type:complete len:249 (-) Transcript_18579:412-1158(-)